MTTQMASWEVGQHAQKPFRFRSHRRSRDAAGGPLCTGTLRRPRNRGEALVRRLRDLDAESFCGSALAPQVRIVADLLQDCLAGHYPHLSLPAFAEMLLVFREQLEGGRAAMSPRDPADSARQLTEIWHRYAREISCYQGWKRLVAVALKMLPR